MSSSSGLMLQEKADGSIHIEVNDYNVESLGGLDYECHFSLSKDNADSLRKAVSHHGGTFKENLIKEFGKNLDIPKFQNFCHSNNIKYEKFTYS